MASESTYLAALLGQPGAASMRPRPIGLGIGQARGGVRGEGAASMRPRPIGLGIAGTDRGLRALVGASMRPRPIGLGIEARWSSTEVMQ